MKEQYGYTEKRRERVCAGSVTDRDLETEDITYDTFGRDLDITDFKKGGVWRVPVRRC